MNNQKQYMTNAQGHEVPVELVKDIDKLRDQTVRGIMEKTLAERDNLVAFKKQVWNDIHSFLALSFEQHGVTFGGKKGNITLTSYDGQYRVRIAVQDVIRFDERLQVAKQLIDEYLEKLTENIDPEIKVFIDYAFQVDKQGNISTARILGLRKYNIKNEKWQQAMQVIAESISVIASKSYMRFYRRLEGSSYQQIPLDVAAL